MYWLFYVCVLFFSFVTSETKLIDELSTVTWLCAKENCTDPISEAIAIRSYIPDDHLKVSFRVNDRIYVLAKSSVPSKPYWLVETGTQKGVAHAQFLREDRVIINKANQVKTVVDLSLFITHKNEETTITPDNIKPSPTKTILDGTTLVSFGGEGSGEEIIADEESAEPITSTPKPGIDINQFKVAVNPLNLDVSNLVENGSVGDISEGQSRTEQNVSVGQVNGGQVDEKIESLLNVDTPSSSYSNNLNYEVLNANSSNVDGISLVNTTQETDIVQSVEASRGIPGNISVESGLDSLSDNNKKELHPIPGPEAVTNTNEKDSKAEAQHTLLDSTVSKLPVTPMDNNLMKDEVGLGKTSIIKEVSASLNEEDHTINAALNGEKSIMNATLKEEVDLGTTLIKEEVSVGKTSVKEESNVGIESVKKEADLRIAPVKEDVTVEESPVKEDVTVEESPVTKDANVEELPVTKDADLEESPFKEESTVFSPLIEVIVSNDQTNMTSSKFVAAPEVQSVDNVTDLHHKEIPLETVHTLPTMPVTANNIHSNLDLEIEKTNPVPTIVATSSTPPFPDPNIEYTAQQVPYVYKNVDDNNIHDQKNDIYSSEIKDDQITPIEGDKSPEEDTSSNSSDLPAEPSLQINTGSLPQVDPLSYQPIPVPDVPIHDSQPPTLDAPVDNSNEDLTSTSSPPLSDYIEQVDSVVNEGNNWFSGFQSVMDSITEMFSKSEISDSDRDTPKLPKEEPESFSEKNVDQEKIIQDTEETLHCENDEYCLNSKDYSQSSGEAENKESGIISNMFEGFSGSQMSPSTLLCLVITSIVVLLFSLGHYYLENLKQDTALITKINTLSAELFFAQKELVSIEEQYQEANEKYQKLVSETSNNELAIEDMRKELDESKAARELLEIEIKRLEKEIESLIEEGDEMHRMLAESFTEEERTKSLLSNISDLRGVLSERLQEIVSLTEQLDKEKQEVELLTISLKKSEEKRETAEEKLAKALLEADLNTLAVTKQFEEKITTLERIVEERSLERTNFEKEICELKGTCELLMTEKELAEKELKKSHGVTAGKALSEWLETKKIRADFLAMQKEVEKLNKELEAAKLHGISLEEKEKQLLHEIEALNNKYEAAEKEKIEALTKLQVLSNYFKEKEIQLQEELGTKEAQWLQKQSEDHTIYEQMRSLREENLSYKAQNEALKKEILDQETSFKIQIANEEQKAQENWINLRHTERRLKEVQMEASHLRSRLTALEANPDSLDEKHKSLEMVNGDVPMGAASPPFMLYPPPDFIPPPPLVSPTRPPPLGRLSSPPLTPPAPLSPYEFFPPPPPSPPPPLRVHKPQPRDHPHRKQKDSQSSNHSSESIEKPVRRGKR